ncbi:thioredoxin domain-containing protein [Alkalibaculum sporogenes]|uniref:thioredoxin domain-containing protein n=1 Tax=Alkalibaculum sporogenes TaxID=2655001 RepID=UPI0031B6080F
MSNTILTNRLAQETSPYLLQHAHNPVDWYPWGEEAFQKAKDEDKPIFFSCGYSTCHWCHVMERESFENEEVAKLLNDAFICIKVDREERPDIDGVYMGVCQVLTGSGGWPLTILMTPDQKPFFAGTYIPRKSQYGRIGMMELVPQIKEQWELKREKILDVADDIWALLQKNEKRKWEEKVIKDHVENEEITEIIKRTFEDLEYSFDNDKGGFGRAPKFPTPHRMLFLLRHWRETGSIDALEMVSKTLNNMRMGGIFDQIGYGLHRY